MPSKFNRTTNNSDMKKFSSFFRISLLVLFLLIILGPGIFAQKKVNGFHAMDYSARMVLVDDTAVKEPFFISTAPVTNIQYIIFLLWTERVYGNDYPEVLFSVLPGFDRFRNAGVQFLPFSDSGSFRLFLKNSPRWVSEYMFNPAFLNSPAIGISWEQANKFCHWLSDRYNEYSLIKHKYFYFDPNQIDEKSFSTEAFVFRQYEGLINHQNISFKDTLPSGFADMNYWIRPSFHLSSKMELAAALKTQNLVTSFSVDSPVPEFLKPFMEQFLTEKKGLIYVRTSSPEGISKLFPLASVNPKEKFAGPSKFSEWLLDSYLSEETGSVEGIYKQYGYDSFPINNPTPENRRVLMTQKDSLGRARVIITGATQDGKFALLSAPVDIKRRSEELTSYIYDHNSGTVVSGKGDVFTCFRVAVKAIK
jgi:hypothetical protein